MLSMGSELTVLFFATIYFMNLAKPKICSNASIKGILTDNYFNIRDKFVELVIFHFHLHPLKKWRGRSRNLSQMLFNFLLLLIVRTPIFSISRYFNIYNNIMNYNLKIWNNILRLLIINRYYIQKHSSISSDDCHALVIISKVLDSTARKCPTFLLI